MIRRAGIYRVKTVGLTALALIAFAANSVLCRLALDEQTIDAASFTVLRLLSGAISASVILGGILLVVSGRPVRNS